MKKLIIGMIAAITAITGYSATDAEIKSLLEKKDYIEVVNQISGIQITNMLNTTLAQDIVKNTVSVEYKRLWKLIKMCKFYNLSVPEIVEFYKTQKSMNAYEFAKCIGTEKLEIETLKWVLDELTDVKCKNISGLGYLTNDTPYFVKCAERIYRDRKSHYSTILTYNMVTDEIKSYVTDAVENKLDSNCFIEGKQFTRLCNWCSKNKSKSYLSRKYFYPELMTTWTNKLDQIAKIQKAEYAKEAYEIIAKNVTDPKEALTFSAFIDKKTKNKEMTKGLYPVISKDIHLAVKTALYLNDVDKMIDIMLNAGEDLTADEIASMIPMVNSLAADYRTTEIVTALRNINSRYTLRLYNERETWEPILSKIRAMIDVRQM